MLVGGGFFLACVPAGSRGGDVTVDDWHKATELAHSFYSILLSVSVFRALSTVFNSTNSPDNSPLSHPVLLVLLCVIGHHHHHQSLNREGRWGTTDDFATSLLHFSLFSTALWDLPNSRPVRFLILFSHLFLCPPCLLPLFTVPCKMVLARPNERETRPYHCSLRLFTIVRGFSCGPIACWILARTFLLVTWSLYEMCSILR